MFFPEKIKSVRDDDKVLEIGPGSDPHFRSDILLEKKFETDAESRRQRGGKDPVNSTKPVIYYDGGRLPFNNKEFDYVICSHVLEHVEDVEFFIGELERVSKGGYLEFPTIYYEYIYDIPEHVSLLFHSPNGLFFMPKSSSSIPEYSPVNSLFFKSLNHGVVSFVDELKEYMFQGFEWRGKIKLVSTNDLSDLTFNLEDVVFTKQVENCSHSTIRKKIVMRLRSYLK